MELTLVVASLDPDAATSVLDWVKVGAGGLTISGLLWAAIYIIRQAWIAYAVNLKEDNVRLRGELDSKNKKIDELYAIIRTKETHIDELDDDNRELRFGGRKLKDQNDRLAKENNRLKERRTDD